MKLGGSLGCVRSQYRTLSPKSLTWVALAATNHKSIMPRRPFRLLVSWRGFPVSSITGNGWGGGSNDTLMKTGAGGNTRCEDLP